MSRPRTIKADGSDYQLLADLADEHDMTMGEALHHAIRHAGMLGATAPAAPAASSPDPVAPDKPAPAPAAVQLPSQFDMDPEDGEEDDDVRPNEADVNPGGYQMAPKDGSSDASSSDPSGAQGNGSLALEAGGVEIHVRGLDARVISDVAQYIQQQTGRLDDLEQATGALAVGLEDHLQQHDEGEFDTDATRKAILDAAHSGKLRRHSVRALESLFGQPADQVEAA